MAKAASSGKSSGKEHKLTICEITQETNSAYFARLTDEEKAVIDGGSAADIGLLLYNKLVAFNYIPQEYHCIIHDKDQRTVWDDRAKNYVIELKPRHFHFYCRFLTLEKVLYSGTLPRVAVAVGVEPQYVQKAPAGKYGWDNMLAYAIHAKDPEKFQYDPAEVASGGVSQNGSPLWRAYQSIYMERKADWERGRAVKTAKRAREPESIDSLEEKILLGEITRSQILLTDELYAVYARNKRRCDDALDTYIQRKIARTIQAMESGVFRVSVFYVTGESGSGKSVFSDKLARTLINEAKSQLNQDWTVCSCAASNPFDDYDGSEVLIMDDLRGMALTAADWLRLLDPDRINIGSARYRNKRIAARCIIINSERDIMDFFYYSKGGGGDRSEMMDQFFRRILAHIVVFQLSGDGDNQDTRRYLRVSLPVQSDEPRPVIHWTGPQGQQTAQTLQMRYSFPRLSAQDGFQLFQRWGRDDMSVSLLYNYNHKSAIDYDLGLYSLVWLVLRRNGYAGSRLDYLRSIGAVPVSEDGDRIYAGALGVLPGDKRVSDIPQPAPDAPQPVQQPAPQPEQ